MELQKPGRAWSPYIGDINGDGRDDILLVNRREGSWSVALSTGTAFLLGAATFGPWAPGMETEPLAGDFNGCGRASLLARKQNRRGVTMDAAVNVDGRSSDRNALKSRKRLSEISIGQRGCNRTS